MSTGGPSTENPLEVSCRFVQQALTTGTPFLLLDCREPNEYAVAKIDGAVLLPMSQLGERVAEIEARKHDSIVVHCHHGGRSLRVAMWLRQQGFTKASSMSGGIDEWSQTIDPNVPRY